MLIVNFTRNFIKSYGRRIKSNKKLKLQFEERVGLFQQNRSNPILKDRGLIGKEKGLRSFSMTGDVRVIYFLESEKNVEFIDIGSHNQVY